jgi:hypothetical protein
LVSHFFEFSVIFYAIYKKQPLTFPIGDAFLQKGPRKERKVCNVALGLAGRRGLAEIRRSPVAGPVGEGWGRIYGSLGIGLGARLVGRRCLWAAHRQPGGFRPPRLAKPAMRTSGGGLSWPVSYWRARGGVGGGRAASRSSGRTR